jgi:tetratricopeptide (TPR) repeat protein
MKAGILLACVVLPLVSLATPYAAHAHNATLCGVLQTTRQFRQAISHCDLALSANPNNIEALSNRGSAHLSLGDFDRALADLSKAIADYRKAVAAAPQLRPVIERNLRRLGVEP